MAYHKAESTHALSSCNPMLHSTEAEVKMQLHSFRILTYCKANRSTSSKEAANEYDIWKPSEAKFTLNQPDFAEISNADQGRILTAA